jgi:hypothetical protein
MMSLNLAAVAIAYHDAALWTDKQLNYLDPSVAAMRQHVAKDSWSDDDLETMSLIIEEHHKVSPVWGCKDSVSCDIANAVRKADWVDFTWGLITKGLPKELIWAAYQVVPDAGFHQMLAGMGPRLSPGSFIGQLAVLRIFKM